MQISGTALVLDEIINHVQSLQRQVEVSFAYLSHQMNLFLTNNENGLRAIWIFFFCNLYWVRGVGICE